MNSENVQSKTLNQGPVTEDKTFIQMEGYNIKANWLKGPFGEASKASALSVDFYNEDLQPTYLPENYSLFVTAEMGMGHGLADRGFFETENQSTFINSEIKFYMSGTYNITLYVFEDDIEVRRSTWSFSF